MNQEIFPYQIVIVDDHPLLRMGTKLSIQKQSKQYNIIAEAETVAQCYEIFEHNSDVDLVLLDIILPDGTGVEVAQYLKTHFPNIKILVLSIDTSESTLVQLLNIGINGFISKSSSPKDLLSAIDSVIHGIDYYGKDAAELINNLTSSVAHQDNVFTKQELKIIKLCANGMMAKEIAESLHISVRTVETHKNNIFKKLGVNNAVELVHYAFMNKLVNI